MSRKSELFCSFSMILPKTSFLSSSFIILWWNIPGLRSWHHLIELKEAVRHFAWLWTECCDIYTYTFNCRGCWACDWRSTWKNWNQGSDTVWIFPDLHAFQCKEKLDFCAVWVVHTSYMYCYHLFSSFFFLHYWHFNGYRFEKSLECEAWFLKCHRSVLSFLLLLLLLFLRLFFTFLFVKRSAI